MTAIHSDFSALGFDLPKEPGVDELKAKLAAAEARIADAVKAWDECEDAHPESCICGLYRMASILTRTDTLAHHPHPEGER